MAVLARTVGRSLQRAREHSVWGPLILPVFVIELLVGCAIAADVAFADRALPGLTVAGIAVGGLNAKEIRATLDAQLATRWGTASVTMHDVGRSWRATNADLGIDADVDSAVAAALAYGKSRPTLDRVAAWADALRGGANVGFTLRPRGDALYRWIDAAARDADTAPVSGSLRVGAAGIEATRPELGREVDRAATVAALLSATSLRDRDVELRVRPSYPAVDRSGFDGAYARALAAVTPLTMRVSDRSVSVDAPALAKLLSIDLVPAAPADLRAIPVGAVAPPSRYRYVVQLADDRVAALATTLGRSLDHDAMNARFSVTLQGAVAVLPGESRVRVDQERLRIALLDTLVRPVSGATRELEAPAAVTRATFTTEQALDLLPNLQRISTFTTQYPPSPARHANISTGSSRFDGVVILPGETFSFWNLIGPITVDRGYAYAGAIINNRSDESVIGGGLCQVATTIFNAIAAQGYELVERHAHGYYIDRYPLGLDAAVFAPGVDLKWRNDTPNPVFLWSWNADQSVTIDVWSIPTGRTVAFSDPAVWNFVPVPADQAADPAFPPGVAVEGRDVWRTRTVTEAGKVLHKDGFMSRYVPVWGGPVEVAATPPTP